MAGNGRFERIFARKSKPIIAMAHLPALPGSPLYDADRGMDGVLATAKRDLDALLAHEIDGILFANEGDRPYRLKADYESIAAMTYVVGTLAPRDRPFGIEFLWDARAALAIAVATGASFIRQVITGFGEPETGPEDSDAASLLRYRHQLQADQIAIFMNITPDFTPPLDRHELVERARWIAEMSLPDALLVAGPTTETGVEAHIETVRAVKKAVGELTPVLVNTGVKQSNVVPLLRVADGAIVGSAFKREGYTWNAVDAERVRLLVDEKKNGLAGEWPG